MSGYAKKVEKAIDDVIHSVATKAASLVIEKHQSDRQGDLEPNTEFTKSRKKRSVNSGMILVDQNKMVQATRAVKRGKFKAAVTNGHKLAGIHAFGGPVNFFGTGVIKQIPARDTWKATIEAEEDTLADHVERAANIEGINEKITVVIS